MSNVKRIYNRANRPVISTTDKGGNKVELVLNTSNNFDVYLNGKYNNTIQNSNDMDELKNSLVGMGVVRDTNIADYVLLPSDFPVTTDGVKDVFWANAIYNDNRKLVHLITVGNKVSAGTTDNTMIGSSLNSGIDFVNFADPGSGEKFDWTGEVPDMKTGDGAFGIDSIGNIHVIRYNGVIKDNPMSYYKSVDFGKTWTVSTIQLTDTDESGVLIWAQIKEITLNTGVKRLLTFGYQHGNTVDNVNGWKKIYRVYSDDGGATWAFAKVIDFSDYPLGSGGILTDTDTIYISEPEWDILGSDIVMLLRPVGNIGSDFNRTCIICKSSDYGSTFTDGGSALTYDDVVNKKYNSGYVMLFGSTVVSKGGHLNGILARIAFTEIDNEKYIGIGYWRRNNLDGTEASNYYFNLIKYNDYLLYGADIINSASSIKVKLFEYKSGDVGSPEGGNGSLINVNNNLLILNPINKTVSHGCVIKTLDYTFLHNLAEQYKALNL